MSNTALCLTALLLLIPIFISYKEGLHIIKDLVIATIRATIQLLILGFLLHYIFEINEKWLLVLCVLVIIINASWNTISRAYLSCIMFLDIICGYICGNSSTIGSNCCYRCN